MNAGEIKCIESFNEELLNGIDPLTFVSSLLKNKHVNQLFSQDVKSRFRNGVARQEIVKYIIKELEHTSTFMSVVLTLDKCGYHRLAARLYINLQTCGIDITRVNKADVGSRTRINTFFVNLKRLVHDAQFSNPRQALRNMVTRYKEQLSLEMDHTKQQQLADKCVAILGVEIDAFYDSQSFKCTVTQDMLEEMKELIPFTSNTLVSDTIYYSRQANFDEFRGDFEHGENMLTRARSSAQCIGSCLELVNMLYIEVCVKLREFESNPSVAVKERLLFWGRIGLECLENETTHTRTFCRRIFILRMVFALLGIGNRANILHNYTPVSKDVEMAETLLVSVDSDWHGIETRREMFYCVAKARLNEQLEQYTLAVDFIQRALHLAEQGKFLEKISYIKGFRDMVLAQSNNVIQLLDPPDFKQSDQKENHSNKIDDTLASNSLEIYKSDSDEESATSLKQCITELSPLKSVTETPRRSFHEYQILTCNVKQVSDNTEHEVERTTDVFGIYDCFERADSNECKECELQLLKEQIIVENNEMSHRDQTGLKIVDNELELNNEDSNIGLLKAELLLSESDGTDPGKEIDQTERKIIGDHKCCVLQQTDENPLQELENLEYPGLTFRNFTDSVISSSSEFQNSRTGVNARNRALDAFSYDFPIICNSIVLFEERGEPEGLSREVETVSPDDPPTSDVTNTCRVTTDLLPIANNGEIRNNLRHENVGFTDEVTVTLDEDFNDDFLFGDGQNESNTKR